MVTYPDSVTNEKKEVHFTDHLGSVRATWNAAGERTATEYSAFGAASWTVNGTKTRAFIGKESDAESNLGDFGARKYDARSGRFTSVDALWEIQPDQTPYHYSYNSPINYSDPSGYFPMIDNSALEKAMQMISEEHRRICEDNTFSTASGTKVEFGGSVGGSPSGAASSSCLGSVKGRWVNVPHRWTDPDPLTPERYISGYSYFIESSSESSGSTMGNPDGSGGGTPSSEIGTGDIKYMRYGWTANESVLSGMSPNVSTNDVKRILSPNEFGVKNFQQQINSFVTNWGNPSSRHYAPAIATYFRNTSIAVSLVEMHNKSLGGLTGRGTPNIFISTDTYNGTFSESFESVMLHETVHAMGGDEFDALAAQVAAGYMSGKKFLDLLNKAYEDFNSGIWDRIPAGREDILYYLSGIEKSGIDLSKIFKGSDPLGGLIDANALVNAMYNHGRNILINGVKR